MNAELKTRIRSFLWQLLYMVLGAVLTFALSPPLLEAIKDKAPDWAWAMPIVVAMATQLSKYINNKIKQSDFDATLRGDRP
jgi:hypothetical protein